MCIFIFIFILLIFSLKFGGGTQLSKLKVKWLDAKIVLMSDRYKIYKKWENQHIMIYSGKTYVSRSVTKVKLIKNLDEIIEFWPLIVPTAKTELGARQMLSEFKNLSPIVAIYLRKIKRGGGSFQNIDYNIRLLNKKLYISAVANHACKFVVPPGFGGKTRKYISINRETDELIEYCIEVKGKFKDFDEAKMYPSIYKNYASFQGMLALFIPSCSGKHEPFTFNIKSDFHVYVSSVGRANGVKLNGNNIWNYLYVLSPNEFKIYNGIIFTHRDSAHFWISRERIIGEVKKASKIYADWLGAKKDIFLINYDSYIGTKKNYGTGGTASIGGFDLNASYAINEFEGVTKSIILTARHELFHNWLNGRGRKIKDEYQMAWLKEGFTDFFSHYLVMSPSAFNELKIKIEKRYANNPQRDLPNAGITRELFWSNYDVQRLPYQRGFLLACRLIENKKQFMANAKKLINSREWSIEIAKKILNDDLVELKLNLPNIMRNTF